TPLKVYRQLSQQYHPDKNPEKDGEEFKKLSVLFNNIPNEIKRSNNWYNKIIFSEIKNELV
ncbi:MAG: DnaJ domain-containing protein, partial [archaeon]